MRKIGRVLFASSIAAGLIASAVAGPSAAKPASNSLSGEGDGLELVANVAYGGGTDMEFRTIKGRDYAFTGSSPNYSGGEPAGFRVIDVTKPTKPKVVAFLRCAVNQADIQISHNNKTAIMAADSAGGPDACLATGRLGFLTIDIKNPRKPKLAGFAEIPRGSHNTTAHPKKPFVYNSDSDVGNLNGEIQIWSIKNPKKPELVNTVMAVGHSPHDISFNKKGDLAVTAGVDDISLYDTSDPENPTLAFVTQCPGCSITHDAKFTPDGKHVIVGDEGGGGAPYPCPGGALYFYDLIDGPAMTLKGVYEPEELVIAGEGQAGPNSCTSHVFDISPNSKRLAISWYSAGTRYLDIEDPTGFALGTNATGGINELGWFIPEGSVSWSSKIYKGWIYSNDMNRGFDVYKVLNK